LDQYARGRRARRIGDDQQDAALQQQVGKQSGIVSEGGGVVAPQQ
jgi:hypothetical protein